ncbi:phosphoribosylanthranilate isomerase [Antarcticibacterium sp. 1MA-6-2]|uniref:phosphoribosylanthranilate isomerase n=1 Tax=Antarcticibacterium sp. 1MA-6-2 TaxID=2908210 RepID=UPI001F2CF241|nr:phosphoribosylanthranilate isomerase [Antarcticibacterium sp. 1MA-6-2]UJH91132.1 phosphoribosylanthranilate isomerase [Antarcticibacterium sp. 1MA-6-2]
MKIKVCGMMVSENIEAVAALQPDYLGFIFYPSSPRNFEKEIPLIASEIKKTGVFVDASVDFVVEKVNKYKFKAVQLHGEESPAYCASIRYALPETEIIKVFSVRDEFEFDILKNYEASVDFFLFDTKGKNKGGNGYAFDWEILQNYPSKTPFFLSGGIGPEDLFKIKNFQQHLEKSGKADLLYAVDLNSKFETEPGYKDVEQLNEFRKILKGTKP